jgi:EXS family
MNSDGLVEIPFAATFPLPFRVLFLAGMGILGWATNLHGLNMLGIDAASALELRKTSTDYSPLRSPLPTHRGSGFKLVTNPASVYHPIYRLFAVFSAWCFFAWAIFRFLTHGNVILVDIFRYVPAICALGVSIILICPFDVIHKRERDMFL